MGGKAAMVLDKLHQGFLSKLVVVDIAPVAYPANFENHLKVLLSVDLGSLKSRSEVDSKLSEYFKDISFRFFLMQNLKLDDNKSFYWRINLTSLIMNAVAISEFPVINGVSNTDALFLYGDLSEYRVEKYRDIIKENFTLSQFSSVAKAGHWVHVEQPAKFVEMVTKFLKTD